MKTTQTIKLILTSLMLTVGLHSVAAPMDEHLAQIGLHGLFGTISGALVYAMFIHDSSDICYTSDICDTLEEIDIIHSIPTSWSIIQTLRARHNQTTSEQEKAQLTDKLTYAYLKFCIASAYGIFFVAGTVFFFSHVAEAFVKIVQNR